VVRIHSPRPLYLSRFQIRAGDSSSLRQAVWITSVSAIRSNAVRAYFEKKWPENTFQMIRIDRPSFLHSVRCIFRQFGLGGKSGSSREVLDGLLRIGFEHHQQIIWDKGRTVLTRTLYWFQHEPCWSVRKKNAPGSGKPARIQRSAVAIAEIHHADEAKYDHPSQKPIELMRRPILNHLWRDKFFYDPFLGSGTT
jgi:hypothetical protein